MTATANPIEQKTHHLDPIDRVIASCMQSLHETLGIPLSTPCATYERAYSLDMGGTHVILHGKYDAFSAQLFWHDPTKTLAAQIDHIHPDLIEATIWNAFLLGFDAAAHDAQMQTIVIHNAPEYTHHLAHSRGFELHHDMFIKTRV